jgi:hypothetical protein
MGRYLSLAKAAIERIEDGSGNSLDAQFDPYAQRMEAALRKIAVPNYPPGMILWLETADPQTYSELTSQIPDEIDRLWNERATLEQFDVVLTEFLNTHRRACELFCAHLKNEEAENTKATE